MIRARLLQQDYLSHNVNILKVIDWRVSYVWVTGTIYKHNHVAIPILLLYQHLLLRQKFSCAHSASSYPRSYTTCIQLFRLMNVFSSYCSNRTITFAHNVIQYYILAQNNHTKYCNWAINLSTVKYRYIRISFTASVVSLVSFECCVRSWKTSTGLFMHIDRPCNKTSLWHIEKKLNPRVFDAVTAHPLCWTHNQWWITTSEAWDRISWIDALEMKSS